jgi:hypothetical protein
VSIEGEGKGERGDGMAQGIINPMTMHSSSLMLGGATTGLVRQRRRGLYGRKKKLKAGSHLSARRRGRRGGGLLLLLWSWAIGRPMQEGRRGWGWLRCGPKGEGEGAETQWHFFLFPILFLFS